MDYLAKGFQDLDANPEIATFVHCLQTVQNHPFFQAYKQQSFDLLRIRPDAQLLEVGCGLGEDVLMLAQQLGPQGNITAFDYSDIMLQYCREKIQPLNLPVQYCQGDAHYLPFVTGTFDGVRIDRTLQHLANPQRAIAEMSRVLKPGGYLVAFEPDWESLLLNATNRSVTRQILNYWCDTFASGWIGRYLLQYFQQAGLQNIEVFPKTLIVEEWDLADTLFNLCLTVQLATTAGYITEQAGQAWLQELLEANQSKTLFCSLTGFLVAGIKP